MARNNAIPQIPTARSSRLLVSIGIVVALISTAVFCLLQVQQWNEESALDSLSTKKVTPVVVVDGSNQVVITDPNAITELTKIMRYAPRVAANHSTPTRQVRIGFPSESKNYIIESDSKSSHVYWISVLGDQPNPNLLRQIRSVELGKWLEDAMAGETAADGAPSQPQQ